MNDINSNEQQLREEVADLKRQLAKVRNAAQEHAPKGPSVRSLLVVVSLFLGLGLAGYYFGYLPRQHRELALAPSRKQTARVWPW